MKRIAKYTSLLAIVLILSCNQEAPEPEYAILSGKFENTSGGEMSVRALKGFETSLNVKDDGTFIDTLYIDEGAYTISFGKSRTTAYLSKGSTIQLNGDIDDFENSLVFAGTHADFNNYYVKKGREEYTYMTGLKEIYSREEKDFVKAIQEIKSKEEILLSDVTGISEELRDKELRSIHYAYLRKMSMYESYHGYFTEKEDFKPSDAFQKELTDMPLDQVEDFFYSQEYHIMVMFGAEKDAYSIKEEKNISYGMAALETHTNLENEIIRNHLMMANVEMRLPMTNDKDPLYLRYMELSTNEEHKKKITELYNYLSALEPGKPSPKFENYENYAGGTTSLDDLKGKYVYIDVWATWCGPCKGQIPFLKEVEKKYHGKKIEFVSISVDTRKDHDTWKQMVQDEELTGVQLFADNAFNSEFIQAYKIRGIPQFILLDPDGNIVEANAPRPSDEKLIALLNSTLKD